jgi:hypothetical protein
MSAPENWQAQAMSAIAQMKIDDPTRTVFGVNLPAEWKHDLQAHLSNVKQLLGVRAITFDGKKKITRVEPPERPSWAKNS